LVPIFVRKIVQKNATPLNTKTWYESGT